MAGKYRLVTRSDFDGLACAVILKEAGFIDDIEFVHPKDMQDGKVKITDRDITTNLPYVDGVHLAFDHHVSETIRKKERKENHIIDPEAPSAARIVYNYYGGKARLSRISEDMMEAVDKADTASFTIDEILNPRGWVLLNYLVDARTGLGRFRNFRISNYNLMMDLIDYCRNYTIEEILALPDVKERSDLYFEQVEKFKDMIKRNARVHKNLLVINLRDEEIIFAGNRFLKYAMYPQCNISFQIIWGFRKQNTVFSIGNSIVNRTSKTNIGEMVLKYGGGGHRNAGTCQIPNDQVEQTLNKLIEEVTRNR